MHSLTLLGAHYCFSYTSVHLFHKAVYSGPKVESKKYRQTEKRQIEEVIAFALLQSTVHAPHALFHGKTSLVQGFFLKQAASYLSPLHA